MYQDYAEETNANSSVFVCDVDKFDENRFIPNFEKRGDKLDRIVLVIWSFLDKIQRARPWNMIHEKLGDIVLVQDQASKKGIFNLYWSRAMDISKVKID